MSSRHLDILVLLARIGLIKSAAQTGKPEFIKFAAKRDNSGDVVAQIKIHEK